jgi:hypothetical protein
MESLTSKTLVTVLTMALWATASIAATGEMPSVPVRPAEQNDSHSATAATPQAPLYALSRLEAQTVVGQAMTDQELKAVEGGASNAETVSGLYGALVFNLMWYDFADGLQRGYCGC